MLQVSAMGAGSVYFTHVIKASEPLVGVSRDGRTGTHHPLEGVCVHGSRPKWWWYCCYLSPSAFSGRSSFLWYCPVVNDKVPGVGGGNELRS